MRRPRRGPGRSARRCWARWSMSRPARAATGTASSSTHRARRAGATDGPSAIGRSACPSRRASTRATRSGCRTRARRARGAVRPGASTWPSTSRPTRRSRARAPSCSTSAMSRWSRRRSARRCWCPPSRARSRSRSRRARSPGPRSGSAASGVPHLRRLGQPRRSACAGQRAVPTKLSKKQRDSLEAYAREAGELFGGPGLREKLGL